MDISSSISFSLCDFGFSHNQTKTQRPNGLRKKSLNASFRAQRGIPLWFKSNKRGIPRHAACLGMKI